MQNEIKNEKFIVRDFQEVPGGHFDEMNFYFTPNGSNYKIINLILTKRFLGS